MRPYLFLLMIVLSSFILLGCRNQTTLSGTIEQEVDSERDNLVTLTADQTKAAGIKSGRLTLTQVTQWTDATGIVDLPPNEIFMTYPRHEGYIREIKVLPGSPVKKGQVLGYYEHPHILDMQQEYLQGRQQLVYLDSVLRREKALVVESAIAPKDVQERSVERDKVFLNVKVLEDKLGMLGINVDDISAGNLVNSLPLRSEGKGYVEAVEINTGMYVTPQTLCFRVYGDDHKHIELAVFKDQLEKIRKGQKVIFSSTGDTAAHQGVVHLVNPSLDPVTTTANIHVHYDDKGINLTPGTRVHARIGVWQDSIYTIPKSELVRIGDQYRVFTLSNGSYRPVWLSTGREGDDWVEVLGPEEIFESELVLSGNYFLQGSL